MGNAITPYFTVDDADRLMKFMVAAFGGTVVKQDRYPDGAVQHARVLVGGSLVMLNQTSQDYAANVSQMHLRVADVDATYDSALRLGATSLMKPSDRPHGERMAGVRDPCENIWWIATGT